MSGSKGNMTSTKGNFTAPDGVSIAYTVHAESGSVARPRIADLRHYQSAMRMPTRVLVGEEDFATPVAMSGQIQKAMPDATLSVLRNVRHLTPIECPDVIAEEIPSLMKRTRVMSE